MQKYRITQQEINENNVKSAADLLRGNAQSNKNVFDKLPELIAERLNKVIDNVYSKLQVDSLINNKIVEIGSADMAKAIYDKNNDGVVDDSTKLGGMPAEYYAARSIAPYTHSGNALSGSGENGKFKATTTGTYTSFTIGGVSYAVKAGSETEIELVKDAWYSFILDTEAKTVNFRHGGAGLNFKIVGGTTQPVSPKENTIWINTDANIGECQFSETKPTVRTDGSQLQDGDIWLGINIKDGVLITAEKKNNIQVNISYCKQYISGNFVEKEVTVFVNNEWVKPRNFIFDGYKTKAEYTFSERDYDNGSVLNPLIINRYGVVTTSAGNKRMISVNELIDFTNITTVTVELQFTGAGTGSIYNEIFIVDEINSASEMRKNYLKKQSFSNNTTLQTISVDVSDMTGSHYLVVSFYRGSNSTLLRLYSIELS